MKVDRKTNFWWIFFLIVVGVLSARATVLALNEIETNDFRTSDMGPDGIWESDYYDAYDPAVAYNPANNEYLVVWEGEDETEGVSGGGQVEIYGQRIDAATGAEIGANDFRISDMGPEGDTEQGAFKSDVVYNSTNNEYLVVWEGEDFGDDDVEIYGQRIDAATGAEVGVNDFRISDMGPEGMIYHYTKDPAVAYNSQNNEYLVVWSANDGTGGMGSNEYEIFGQRINAATGAEVGTNDFRISDMGPNGVSYDYGAYDPDVTYNPTNNQYLVVWEGDDNTGGLVSGEFEIFGQRIRGSTGSQMGANDFRISDMGPDGDDNYSADNPAVAYNSEDNQYLVVWDGQDGSPPSVNNGIFGQRLDSAGREVGANDFRIYDKEPADRGKLAVTYNTIGNQYLVAWSDALASSSEFEILGQLVDGATGAETGTSDFRISDMGPDGDEGFVAYDPAVAYNPTKNQYLVVWEGTDDPPGGNQYEIFGQRLGDAVCGNGIVETDGGEECDDGGANSDTTSDACRSKCTDPSCGDGVTDGGEQCDDGNKTDGDGCNASCVSEVTPGGGAGEGTGGCGCRICR